MAPFKVVCLLIALGASLAACKKEVQVEVKYICPALLPYSKDFQSALDREIAQLEAPYLFQILNDYGVTRDAIRTCIKKRNEAAAKAKKKRK